MWLRNIIWFVLAVLATGLIASAPARAGGTVVGNPLATCVARAQAGMTAAQVLTRPRDFDCTTPQIRLGPGDYWAVTAGPIPAEVKGGTPLGVRARGSWQGTVTLYALYRDGRIVERRMDDAQASRAVQLGGFLQHRLPYSADPPVRLAWKIENAANLAGILIAPHIADPTQSAQANLTMAALYSGFAGLAAALLIHNLAMWRVLRQRFQLWYAAMLAAILAYTFSVSGALAWTWPDVPNTMRLRINYLTLAIAAVAALRFARSFFEDALFRGQLGRVVDITCITMLTAATLFVIAAPWRIGMLNMLCNIAFLGVFAVAGAVLWRAWRLRSAHFKLFAIAWAAPLVLGLVRISYGFGLVGWNFWVENSTLLGVTAEALAASLMIAYRLRQLASERDLARAEELAARLLADTDPLTGLLNRRAFMERAIGREGDQALLILDLDLFKSVNETIGHDGGDEVLRRIGRVLRAACPADGLVTRFGGEEFAMLSPARGAPGAEALLARVRETRMPYDLKVTASIGGCVGPVTNEKDWKALYREADRALFAAKKAGRDRARTANPALAA